MNTALKDNPIEGRVIEDPVIPNIKEKAAKQREQFKPVDVRTRRERIVAIVGKYVGYLLGGTVLVASASIAILGVIGSYVGVPLMIGGLTWALLSMLGAGVIITPGLYLMGIGLVLFGINMLLRAFTS